MGFVLGVCVGGGLFMFVLDCSMERDKGGLTWRAAVWHWLCSPLWPVVLFYIALRAPKASDP